MQLGKCEMRQSIRPGDAWPGTSGQLCPESLGQGPRPTLLGPGSRKWRGLASQPEDPRMLFPLILREREERRGRDREREKRQCERDSLTAKLRPFSRLADALSTEENGQGKPPVLHLHLRTLLRTTEAKEKQKFSAGPTHRIWPPTLLGDLFILLLTKPPPQLLCSGAQCPPTGAGAGSRARQPSPWAGQPQSRAQAWGRHAPQQPEVLAPAPAPLGAMGRGEPQEEQPGGRAPKVAGGSLCPSP